MRVPEEAGACELRSARARLVEVAAHWRLAPAETAALLGLEVYGEASDFLADVPDADAETRMRLIIDVARELDQVFPEDVLLDWLRDDEDGMETPLAFMSRGATELRAMRAAAAARHGT